MPCEAFPRFYFCCEILILSTFPDLRRFSFLKLVENMTQTLCNALSQKDTVQSQEQINSISASVLSLVQHDIQLTSKSKVPRVFTV